ncbi:uncharacterized protein (DUF302 family) [Sphingopyxis sp. OAS728]|uniref:DUF302 domain-containing protein n=1 Tax=Sphingopyxis sp. OAS728 TaxID=2663823 RepID=UPI00178B1C85|nr:DUF302 domain-containing protein [Sphingopyxis sp. OAS728]MBE1527136.1 uncharacterized protein (DUF302 family) [Sphingopyxis sp. OAS728]
MPRLSYLTLLFTAAACICSPVCAQTADTPIRAERAADILTLKSANGFDDTVTKLTGDVAAKGIRHFATIDQAELAGGAGLPLGRSTLVLFGNPPLGVQFLQSNPYAGLDWPVRMLVTEDAAGAVTVSWTDFSAIASRYSITDRTAQFKMASEVTLSIATAATH